MTRYEQARLMAQLSLRGVTERLTTDHIRQSVTDVLSLPMFSAGPERVDIEALVRDLETRFNVWIGDMTVLDAPEDHIVWLPDRRSTIPWRFWNRYNRYLEEERGWAPVALKRLDEISGGVLGRLEDPLRKGPWDRRGMVAGQVQSGKTANYTALICKAADAGYKLIIVLAGLHNNLRSQTQLRLDEGFLGFDTQKNRAYATDNRRVGVGLLKGEEPAVAHSLTTSADNGDFNKRVAEGAGINIGGTDPVLLVVKKNKSVLSNLYSWATSICGERDPDTGRLVVRDVPLLLIDDEADNASINTLPVVDDDGNVLEDYDITAINRLIRSLLYSFNKSAYVGYTATPFANIYIYPEPRNDEVGEDLFPRSFIVNLPEASTYVGPVKVFGMAGDLDLGFPAQEPLPIIRPVKDHQEWIPDGHKKDLQLGSMPESIKQAMRAFILSCAARIARGAAREHCSMLVHVTRYTLVQSVVTELVKEELQRLQRLIEFGEGNSRDRLIDRLERDWLEDFIPTTKKMAGEGYKPLRWHDVRPHLHHAASRIQVKTINGHATDILDYSDHPNGLSVIAIGGDKLSRGLTLEGLAVSYYLRASRMYDTLMQMGRWFGYRPNYLDLCRLYTTQELVDWYRYITLASEELRKEFDHMSAMGLTPKEYGLRVRSHPAGLTITSAAKMRSGTEMSLSYAGTVSETVVFHTSPKTIQENADTVDRLLADCGSPVRGRRESFLWESVPGERIGKFLDRFQTHAASTRARSELLSSFVRAQIEHGELTDWTVALVQNSGNPDRDQWKVVGGHEVGLITRADHPEQPSATTGSSFSIRRLLSPPDEALDLTDDQIANALQRTVSAWRDNPRRYRRDNQPSEPSGIAIREERSPSRGLLLIYPLFRRNTVTTRPVMGIGLSFPSSENASEITYVVNPIYWQQELETR
jgi:hypothetical protein